MPSRSLQFPHGAIPTKFDGIEYRSRLEARWASFMRKIGWHYTYEPLDGAGYIPDFIVYGDRPLFIEVKPAITLAEYQQPVHKIDASGLAHDVLIVGVSPFLAAPGVRYGGEAAGWLGERSGFHNADPGDESAWDYGEWIQCEYCRTINVVHAIQSFHGRPCGHYDGDGYLGEPPWEVMRARWDEASNEVKWRGSSA